MDRYKILQVNLDKNEYICFELFEKQPTEVFYEKGCSENFHKIHRKTPVPESIFLINIQPLDLQPH